MFTFLVHAEDDLEEEQVPDEGWTTKYVKKL